MTTHFCMGKAVSSLLTIGQGNTDCGMEKMTIPCESDTSEQTVKAENCCENEYISLDTDNNFETFAQQTDFNAKFIFAFAYTFLHLESSTEDKTSNYRDYSPPLLKRDTQVLYQTFLI